MSSTTVTKGRPGQHPHPGETPAAPHDAASEEPQQAGQGPAPRAVTTAGLVLTNYSFAPGPYWMEFTNPTQFALTVGSNTITATLPIAGPGFLLTDLNFDKPMFAGVLPEGTFTPEEGLPVPQSSKKLVNDTALPATAGVRNVVLNKSATPPTISIHVFAQTAGNVPARSRWFVFTLQGV